MRRVYITGRDLNPLIDSSEATVEDVERICDEIIAQPDYPHIVTHGTDTLDHSACKIERILCSSGCNGLTVLTGAMEPMESHSEDGPLNLKLALAACQSGLQGVIVAFGEKLIAPASVVKLDPYDPRGIVSRRGGELGRLEPNGGLRIYRRVTHYRSSCRLHLGGPGTVRVIKMTQETTDCEIHSCISSGARGLVFELFGDGNMPVQSHRGKRLLKAIGSARQSGLTIVGVSQCPMGFVRGAYEGGQALREAGVESGGGLTTAAAIARLLTLLALCDKHSRQVRWDEQLPGDSEVSDLPSELIIEPPDEVILEC